MSEQFGYEIINGHAKTLDAVDMEDNLYKYKHFKVSSSNHTWTFNVFTVANRIELITGIRGILTSNKLWELLVSGKLGHRINPEQRKHDANDEQGRTYGYKVTKKYSWKFQDISENVLESYIQDEKMILAVLIKRSSLLKMFMFAIRKQ